MPYVQGYKRPDQSSGNTSGLSMRAESHVVETRGLNLVAPCFAIIIVKGQKVTDMPDQNSGPYGHWIPVPCEISYRMSTTRVEHVCL